MSEEEIRSELNEVYEGGEWKPLTDYILNLQQRIDKARRILNANTNVENIYEALCNLLLDEDYKYEIDNEDLLSILKGE